MKHGVEGAAEVPRRVIGTTISLSARLARALAPYKWPVVAFLWVVTVVLGYIGLSKYLPSESLTVPDKIYAVLQLFNLGSETLLGPVGWELQAARFLAPMMALYTTGQAIAVAFGQRLRVYLARFYSGHIVICGLGRKGLLLTRTYREQGKRVAVLEHDEDNSFIGMAQEAGAVVSVASAAEWESLRHVGADAAERVIAVCGNDGTNAEISAVLQELVGQDKPPLPLHVRLTRALIRLSDFIHHGGRREALACHLHVNDPQLLYLLREHEIRTSARSGLVRTFFNVSESGARILLELHPPDAPEESWASAACHVVVVGIGHLGQSVVVNVARRWRRGGPAECPRRITLVDLDAQMKREVIVTRYPSLLDVCQLVAIGMDIPSSGFEQCGFLLGDEGQCAADIIYVCLDSDSAALQAALIMHRRVQPHLIRIVVCMTYDSGLASLLKGPDYCRNVYREVAPYGLLNHACTPEMIEDPARQWRQWLARAIHESYVHEQVGKGETPETNQSLVAWEHLPYREKESNLAAAADLQRKLDIVRCAYAVTTEWEPPTVTFSPKEVEDLAKDEHRRWCEQKVSEGIRYGLERSEKTHPSIRPWEDLSESEREKDREQVRALPGILARAGFYTYRLT